MKYLKHLSFFFISLILLGACGSTKKLERPEEKYDVIALQESSYLNLPIEIDIEGLEKSLDRDRDGLIYEDNDFKDDGLMMKLSKQGPIEILADTNKLNYTLPLDVWIKYDAGITNVEGKGKIKLEFLTAFNIDPTWQLSTNSSIEKFEWIEKPKIRVAGVNLSVGFLGNLIMNNSKSIITKTIDDLVSANLPLRDLVQQAWIQLQEPILVSSDYNTWLSVNPRSIGMTPLQTLNKKIVSQIVVESQPKIRLGNRPADGSSSFLLPPFEYKSASSDGFAMYITADLTYEEAQRLAREEAVGETYDYGKRSFTVEDISFFGQGDQLVVDVLLSGSYTGNIYLTGKPTYNERKNTIDIKNLKYTLNTKNILFKTAGFILKSTFKNKIEDTLNFYLEYNLEETKKQVQAQLEDFRITNGISLKGDLDDLSIQNVGLTPEGMRVDILMGGKLNVIVQGLN